jgi:hypothetical protein
MQSELLGPLFPANVNRFEGGLELCFRDISSDQFRDPFCHETLQRFGSARGRRTVIGRDRLYDVAESIGGADPSGIIFHTARCGSTLIAQMLKTIEGVVVYSEPPAVNELLLPPNKWNMEDTVQAVRVIVRLLALHAGSPFVIKLRSWNTLFCRVIIEAFPSTPWLFAVREPVEVAVSAIKRPPTWMRARSTSENPFLHYLAPSAPVTEEEYVTRMYAAFCDSIAALDPCHGLWVNYTQLPTAVWSNVVPHFSLLASEFQQTEMIRSSLEYSKSPLNRPQPFVPDSIAKQASASPLLREAVRKFAMPALHRLAAAIPGLIHEPKPPYRNLSHKH